MTNFILGLHGLKRSGKDTFANEFVGMMKENHKQSWAIDSFADPLRKLGLAMFGITEENRETEIDGIGKTGRQFLQIVGTEVGRQFHPDTWVRSFDYRTSKHPRVICTDVRFNNEAEYIRANGGMIVHVIRPQGIAQKDVHASESGIHTRYIDYTLMNWGTLEDWRQQVRGFAAAFDVICQKTGKDLPFERDH